MLRTKSEIKCFILGLNPCTGLSVRCTTWNTKSRHIAMWFTVSVDQMLYAHMASFKWDASLCARLFICLTTATLCLSRRANIFLLDWLMYTSSHCLHLIHPLDLSVLNEFFDFTGSMEFYDDCLDVLFFKDPHHSIRISIG